MTANRDFANTSDKPTGPSRADRLSPEIILARCQALPEADRALIRAVYLTQQPASELARVRGERTRVLRRHLRAILARIRTPEFLFVLRSRARWGPRRRRIATALFIEGRTIKQAAAALELTYFEVRRHRDAIVAMVEAQNDLEPPAPATASAFLKAVRA